MGDGENRSITPSIAALLGALVVHYLVYAYRFMWYLDNANFAKLVSVYAVFLAAIIFAFVVVPRWWVMGPLALAAMFAPTLVGVHYLVPIGTAFVLVAVVCSSLFAGVAVLRSRGRNAP